MNHVAALVEKFFSSARGVLRIGGISVEDLAEQYGTPLFIYDCSVMERKATLLRETLPSRFSISYSVKANPNLRILRYFLDRHFGLEIASAGELACALRAGCPPERILFAGPGKSEAELEVALARGIAEIHIESLTEAKRIMTLCRRFGWRARVALRVNPTGEAQGGAMRMGGKPAPFGIDEEALDDVLQYVLSDPHLELKGIHLFIGTQILDAEILVEQYRKGLEIARRIASRIHRPLETLDFGGGLGIPYFANEQELDMRKLRTGLATLVNEIEDDPLFVGTRFMVEPGRFLVGDAGIYVTRVNDVKMSRGKKFLIVNGGMNHHLAASGNLGQVIKRNFPVAILNKLDGPSLENVDVVGPLCTPLDVLAREISLPSAEIGDLVGVFQSGAYARSASPLGFLSHATPPEVWVDEGRAELIRPRGNLENDVFSS